MKKHMLAIAMTGIMAVSGASALMADDFPKPEEGSVPASEAVTETETEEEDPFPVDIVDEVEIITPYYSITLPDSWAEAYAIATVSNETGMWLKLLYNRDGADYRGHLFSILMTDREDYKIIADHDLLGELKDSAGNEYHVVAVFPTDVQYSREDMDSYTEMYHDADVILDSITAADGCIYDPHSGDAGKTADEN